MSESQINIKVVTALDAAIGAFSQLKGEINKTGEAIKEQTNLQKEWKNSIGEVAKRFNETVEAGKKLIDVLKGAYEVARFSAELDNLSRRVPVDRLRMMQSATEGVVDKLTLMQFATKAMAGELHVTEAGLQTVLKAAQSLANQGFGETMEIAEKLNEALRKGSSDGLKEFGISLHDVENKNTNVVNILKEYHKQIGKVTEVDPQLRALDRLKAGFSDLWTTIKAGAGEALSSVGKSVAAVVELLGQVTDPNGAGPFARGRRDKKTGRWVEGWEVDRENAAAQNAYGIIAQAYGPVAAEAASKGAGPIELVRMYKDLQSGSEGYESAQRRQGAKDQLLRRQTEEVVGSKTFHGFGFFSPTGNVGKEVEGQHGVKEGPGIMKDEQWASLMGLGDDGVVSADGIARQEAQVITNRVLDMLGLEQNGKGNVVAKEQPGFRENMGEDFAGNDQEEMDAMHIANSLRQQSSGLRNRFPGNSSQKDSFLGLGTDQNEETRGLRKELGDTNSALGLGFSTLQDGIMAAMDAAITGSKSIGQALKLVAGAALKSLAMRATGEALFETAAGFASLAMGPIGGVGAAAHFKAAAVFAACAAVSGGLAAALGGGVDHGAGGGGAASAGGGASYSNGAAAQSAPGGSTSTSFFGASYGDGPNAIHGGSYTNPMTGAYMTPTTIPKPQARNVTVNITGALASDEKKLAQIVTSALDAASRAASGNARGDSTTTVTFE